MRWLKSLVIVLGLLIILGLILLSYGFYKKTTEPGWRLFGMDLSPATVQPQPAANLPVKPEQTAEPLPPFGTLSLNLPLGCVITKVTPHQSVTYLEIGPSPDCNRVVVVDLTAGRVLGTFKPRP